AARGGSVLQLRPFLPLLLLDHARPSGRRAGRDRAARAVAGLPGGARERAAGGAVAWLALAADARRDGGGAALLCRPVRGPVRVAAPPRRGRLPVRGCGPRGGAAAPRRAPCSRGFVAGGVAYGGRGDG